VEYKLSNDKKTHMKIKLTNDEVRDALVEALKAKVGIPLKSDSGTTFVDGEEEGGWDIEFEMEVT